ncbi:replicative DNA helicase [Paenibacillus glucanolyticus]|uniref:replicative DNA helicase n=1 Tax=Paenibacillus glucanolyticus TaxID=59843 RepID=UPI00128C99D1|nr:DnaB-like helicase C-terminal domain-containing protein [Paenibacillus glucanolyticus]MPY15817.1 AAA family ATPase [Paenibacillus glucanolyticus]
MNSYIADKPRAITTGDEVIGAFLSDPTLFQSYKHTLSPELFQELDWLYKLMQEVEEEEGLTFKGIVHRCDTDRIKQLHDLKGTFFNENRVPNLIRTLKKEHLGTNLNKLARNTIYQLNEDEDPDETLRSLQQSVLSLHTSESESLIDPDREVDEWAEYMLEVSKDPSKAYGLMTGLPSLDGITKGWFRQDFSVVGARTSMGKTAFMLEVAIRLHQAGYKVAIFSLEMIKRQLFNRMMSNLMQVSYELFRTGRLAYNHYDTMMRRKNEIKGIYVDDTRGISADYIADSMRRIKRTQGLDFVVVDYIQDVQEKGEQNDNGGSSLARVCRKLRAAAQESDCHVMGLSQVTRAVEDRPDKRPRVSDLAGSTGIETSADVIALLYRDDYYDPDTAKQGIIEINFAKQRNGKLGTVELKYDRDCQRMYELHR